MASDKQIAANQTNGETSYIKIDRPPQECPICHRGQRPVDLNVHFLLTEPNDGAQLMESIYRCTFSDCEHTFIAGYAVFVRKGIARLLYSSPKKHKARSWDDAINKVSPDFVEIYSQASEAEAKELGKIAGPGYRKALEFLIKDWLIANNFDESEKIRTKMLGKCINDYIEEKHIKSVASRAAWLGNDETHYYRVWNEKDINDLKKLIELTANWININELSSAVVDDMP